MPFVVVSLVEGITAEQKRAMSEGITEVVAKGVGLPPDHIWVRFDEFSADNAGRGGVPYSAIEEIEINVKKKSGVTTESPEPSQRSTTPWKSV